MINETMIPTGYVPIYFLYLIVSILLISFIGLTYLYKSKKTNWGNFWQVILFSSIITGIALGFLLFIPETFVSWVTKLKSFFGF